MKEAFRIITEDDKVKAILVNVFGGIVNCATIANGIVNAVKSIGLSVGFYLGILTLETSAEVLVPRSPW